MKKIAEIPKFTKKMKKEYTLLMPSMLPIHFQLIKAILQKEGYNVVLCQEDRPKIIEEGLMSTHNDMCYPAMLVVGQLIHELKSGRHDLNKTALMMFQTGGGCRASNYIYMIRKALEKNGLKHVPVISVSLSGLEKHPGFKLTLPLGIKVSQAILYGDLLMQLRNQSQPYEVGQGEANALVEKWIKKLSEVSTINYLLKRKSYYEQIVSDFSKLEKNKKDKIKVGIVGEIYMKYAPLGNNYLEEFLMKEDIEVVMSGVADFFMYCLVNPQNDYKLYQRGKLAAIINRMIYNILNKEHAALRTIIADSDTFRIPTAFDEIQEYGKQSIHMGVKMGEGWLLTAEMVELIKSEVPNIICAQPFGCLPNHVSGKGMMRKLKEQYPQSNIVTIDYDPSDSKVNQENRLKLMIAQARLQNKIG